MSLKVVERGCLSHETDFSRCRCSSMDEILEKSLEEGQSSHQVPITSKKVNDRTIDNFPGVVPSLLGGFSSSF